MWRYTLLLLLVLPPVAILLNHDPISAILIIIWTMLIIPLCILQVIDYLSNSNGDSRSALIRNMLRVPVTLFGLLSSAIGATIIVWCLYNVFIQRLPEYSGPTNVLGLVLIGFGIGPKLISMGFHWMRLALGRVSDRQNRQGNEADEDEEAEGRDDNL